MFFYSPDQWLPPVINVYMSRATFGSVLSDMSRKFNCIHGKQRLIQMSALELQMLVDGLEVQVQRLIR